MLFFRFILGFASPEFRSSYGETTLRDIRESAADHGHDPAYMARAYGDLVWAIASERATLLSRQIAQAVRSFGRTPIVSSLMALTLAAGIGSNVAAFSIFSGVLLHPLPFAHADQMTTVYRTTWSNGIESQTARHSAYGTFALRDENRTFAAMAAFKTWAGVLSGSDAFEPKNVDGVQAGVQLFDVTQTRPQLGRLFTPPDETSSAPDVFVVSSEFWHGSFNANPSVVGRTFFLNGHSAKLIGVLPAGFIFPDFRQIGQERPNLYIPIRHTPGLRPGHNSFGVIGRLNPGVALERAQRDLSSVALNVWRRYPKEATDDGIHPDGVRVVALSETLFGDLGAQLSILLAAVLGVLLITCFNVANLLLARAIARRHDVAVHVAIGATARHLFAQVAAESVVLTAVAAGLALVFARLAIALFISVAPSSIQRVDQIGLDWPVLLYAGGIAVLTALLTSLFPMWFTARSSLSQTLKIGDRSAAGGAMAVRNVLAVAQIAFAFALIVACGLLVRSFFALSTTNPGYETGHLTDIYNGISIQRYPTLESKRRLYLKLASRFAATPGVDGVAFGSQLPLDGTEIVGDFRVVGTTYHALPTAHWTLVSPNYFATLGVHLQTGREFTDRDTLGALPVILVNAEFVRRFIPDGHAIGKRIFKGLGSTRYSTRTIVGVLPNIKLRDLGEDIVPSIFLPALQTDADAGLLGPAFVLRSRLPQAALTQAVTESWRAVDLAFPPPSIFPVPRLIADITAPARTNAVLLGMMALLALVLAVSGTASVVSYSVARRTSEIGLRMALGAQINGITATMMRGAAVITAAGVALGLLVAFFGAAALSSMLYATQPLDPLIFAAVTLTLATTTLFASFVPAYRAAHTDPAIALRYE